MPTPYRLRVTQTAPAYDAVLEWIVKLGGNYVVVRHSPDKQNAHPHFHALLWDPVPRKELAFRNAMKKATGVTGGNAAYSLKPADADQLVDYERYLCHGNHKGDTVEVLACQGLSPDGTPYGAEWAATRHEEFHEVAERRREAARNGGVGTSLVQLCVDHFRGLGVDGPDRHTIARFLVKHHLDQRKPINIFALKHVCNTVWALLDDSDESARHLEHAIAQI